jgi:hypothetical protein
VDATRSSRRWWLGGYLKVSSAAAFLMVAAALYLVASHLTMVGEVAPGRKLLIQSFATNAAAEEVDPILALDQISKRSIPKSSKLGSTSLST